MTVSLDTVSKILEECYGPVTRDRARQMLFGPPSVLERCLGIEPPTLTDEQRAKAEDWIATAPLDEIAKAVYPMPEDEL